MAYPQDDNALVTKWGTLNPALSIGERLDLINKATVKSDLPAMLPTQQILEALDPTEAVALTAPQASLLTAILTCQAINVGKGANGRALLQKLFAGKPTTLANLSALAAKYDAQDMLWRDANGYGLIGPGDLERAKLS